MSKKSERLLNKKATKQGKRFKSLKDEIIERLGYSSLRSSFYPKYFQKVGIKACVYCNSQLTVSTESIKRNNKNKIRFIKTYKAKFQVDHYYPKAEYPYLSISFFNLYPVCASCNNSKSDKELLFELYTDNPTKLNKSDFEFAFVDGSVARYKTSKDIDDIEFTFNEPTSKKNTFQELFDIQGIYNTQKDIAEELIRKSEIYTESYKKTLITTFPKIFDNNSISNRLIVGNYVEPENIHKRPMAKFMQDLANQLELTIK